jgi:serine/threonine protein kinase
VVQYVEHIDWEEYLYIVMEYVPGGDLGSLINQHGRLPEFDVNTMACQLLSALKYLHNKGITHRDVKPDNILISSRDPFQVKLTDFGLSKMIDSEETFLRTFCGTLLYCAPEVYSEYREYDQSGRRNLRGLDKRSLPPQRYGHAVDIWSLAGVLFYALCGSPPYPVKNGTSYQELLNQIMTQPLDIRPLQRADISESGIRFVRRMLHIHPEYRATIEDLERSAWLGGSDSMELSMEDDEVDMIVDGVIDPHLAKETSQLSIHHSRDRPIEDSEVFGDENANNMTEPQRLEIPSSFSTDGSKSTGHESLGFIPARAQNGNRKGRLFGEVNISDLGSSGAIPADQLDLPLPTAIHREFNSENTQESKYTQSEPGTGLSPIESTHQQIPIASATMPITMAPPPPPHSAVVAIRNQEADQRAVRSSSLMGAESMVGHLNMHSPSATSPNADSPAATTEEILEPAISLRRPREEFEYDTDHLWRPSDLPPKRRRKSEREIDMPLPASVFWDPRDKSTHHYNYPRMSNNDFQTYQEYAAAKGEKFMAGQKTFETTMQSFRSSRSPSLEPEANTRAHSEPTKDEGRRMLMMRDERNLTVSASGHGNGSNDPPARDECLPSTGHPSNHGSPESGTNASNSPQNESQPVVGNDFQPPKRILGKVIATPDSCLPTITLNLTEPVTSWGRGHNATVRYTNGYEIRIPKYAFKIFLFKPDFYSAERSSTQATKQWTEKDQDMTFYISSKASLGIWINDTKLCSHDRQNPSTESKYWGELRHLDYITVWFNDHKESEYTRFRFECFWGKSKEPRKEGDEFTTLNDGPLLAEIERTCLVEENEILMEQIRREEEEKKTLEEEKEREKVAHEKPVNFTQSFSSTTRPSS